MLSQTCDYILFSSSINKKRDLKKNWNDKLTPNPYSCRSAHFFSINTLIKMKVKLNMKNNNKAPCMYDMKKCFYVCWFSFRGRGRFWETFSKVQKTDGMDTSRWIIWIFFLCLVVHSTGNFVFISSAHLSSMYTYIHMYVLSLIKKTNFLRKKIMSRICITVCFYQSNTKYRPSPSNELS